ncbi:hypothetical protein DFH06DRAFT_1299642 [Mycena polygramma]|nr:hypothetical protein DFH06DRAFT_1299642 [Mycena polygramma]
MAMIGADADQTKHGFEKSELGRLVVSGIKANRKGERDPASEFEKSSQFNVPCQPSRRQDLHPVIEIVKSIKHEMDVWQRRTDIQFLAFNEAGMKAVRSQLALKVKKRDPTDRGNKRSDETTPRRKKYQTLVTQLEPDSNGSPPQALCVRKWATGHRKQLGEKIQGREKTSSRNPTKRRKRGNTESSYDPGPNRTDVVRNPIAVASIIGADASTCERVHNHDKLSLDNIAARQQMLVTCKAENQTGLKDENTSSDHTAQLRIGGREKKFGGGGNAPPLEWLMVLDTAYRPSERTNLKLKPRVPNDKAREPKKTPPHTMRTTTPHFCNHLEGAHDVHAFDVHALSVTADLEQSARVETERNTGKAGRAAQEGRKVRKCVRALDRREGELCKRRRSERVEMQRKEGRERRRRSRNADAKVMETEGESLDRAAKWAGRIWHQDKIKNWPPLLWVPAAPGLGIGLGTWKKKISKFKASSLEDSGCLCMKWRARDCKQQCAYTAGRGRGEVVDGTAKRTWWSKETNVTLESRRYAHRLGSRAGRCLF